MSSWNQGIPTSKEIKKKISEAMQGRVPWNKGKVGLMPVPKNKGKKLSDETRAKISANRKGGSSWNAGLKWDAETKAKISATQRRRHEQRRKA